VFNDRCAIGVLDTLLRAGVTVPGDISLVGCDDSRLARLSTVNLTTVGQDARSMANLAVTRAVGRLTGQLISERHCGRVAGAVPQDRRGLNVGYVTVHRGENRCLEVIVMIAWNEENPWSAGVFRWSG